MPPTDAEMPEMPWRKTRKKARLGLGVDIIVDAAIKVIGYEGLDGVSMRRVAQELGTGPASLYAHVSSKEELLELMLDRVAGMVRLPAEPDPERWKEQIEEIALEVVRVYSEHRDIALVSLASIPGGPNQLRVAEFMLDLLLRAGVPAKVAVWAIDRLSLMLDADAIEGAIFRRKEEEGVSAEEYMEGVRDYFARLPGDVFPRLTALHEELMQGDSQDRLTFGLDIFLRGVESFINDRPAGPERGARSES